MSSLRRSNRLKAGKPTPEEQEIELAAVRTAKDAKKKKASETRKANREKAAAEKAAKKTKETVQTEPQTPPPKVQKPIKIRIDDSIATHTTHQLLT